MEVYLGFFYLPITSFLGGKQEAKVQFHKRGKIERHVLSHLLIWVRPLITFSDKIAGALRSN